MKLITNIVLIIITVFISSCKAQTTTDYINFYNDVVPKMNTIIPYKTQFYGQNFSNFYNELLTKNITVVELGCHQKIEPSSKYYVLHLYLADSEMWSAASKYDYQYPWISITFENEIPNQIKSMILQSHGQWNNTFLQFFSNMKIESIKFIGVRGYDNPDYSGK